VAHTYSPRKRLREFRFKESPGKKIIETQPQLMNWAWWYVSIFPTAVEGIVGEL
jgi:hypothetical protein